MSTKAARTIPPPEGVDPGVAALVTDLIGRVADKWTMLILEVLTEHGTTRFTRIGKLVEGISQKMLTQTLRQMERDGPISRTVYPVVPPKVEYQLTELGSTLGAAGDLGQVPPDLDKIFSSALEAQAELEWRSAQRRALVRPGKA